MRHRASRGQQGTKSCRGSERKSSRRFMSEPAGMTNEAHLRGYSNVKSSRRGKEPTPSSGLVAQQIPTGGVLRVHAKKLQIAETSNLPEVQ